MSEQLTQTDAILLSAARTGDRDAFRVLYDRYASTLYRIAFSGTHNVEDAGDLVQDCFAAFWLHMDHTENVGAYLYTTVKNRLFDFYARQEVRTRHLLQQPYDPVAPDDVFALLRAKEIKDCIARAVADLPEKTREVYRLSQEEQLTIGELAALLQRSPQTIKNQLHTALQRIRTELRNSHLNGWLFFI